jgi:hypothetical protein
VKTGWATLLAAILVFCGGCVTKPDWIQSTLVTADVSGVWQGRATGQFAAARYAEFNLRPEGPKVTGTVSATVMGGRYPGAGPLEGRVGGDVFYFTVRGEERVWTGELTVSNDQMEGMIIYGHQRYGLLLRRISPASAPASN